MVADALEHCSQDRLGFIAAAELEDLIKEHGSEIIEQLEARAAVSSRFREALTSTWIWSVDPDLFGRVERTAGSPLIRPDS